MNVDEDDIDTSAGEDEEERVQRPHVQADEGEGEGEEEEDQQMVDDRPVKQEKKSKKKSSKLKSRRISPVAKRGRSSDKRHSISNKKVVDKKTTLKKTKKERSQSRGVGTDNDTEHDTDGESMRNVRTPARERHAGTVTHVGLKKKVAKTFRNHREILGLGDDIKVRISGGAVDSLEECATEIAKKLAKNTQIMTKASGRVTIQARDIVNSLNISGDRTPGFDKFLRVQKIY